MALGERLGKRAISVERDADDAGPPVGTQKRRGSRTSKNGTSGMMIPLRGVKPGLLILVKKGTSAICQCNTC